MRHVLFAVVVVFLMLFSGCVSNPVVVDKTVVLPPVESIDSPPAIVTSNNIKFLKASEIKSIIKKHAGLDYFPEDSKYFIPTKANMDVIIPYLDSLFTRMGIHYIADGTDCDDFARLKAELSQLIISQAYGIEASPTIFVIFVLQEKTWAGVPSGGAHAVCVYSCINEDDGNSLEVYVWEPQTMDTIKIADYPNKDSIFFVGGEVGGENEKKDK